MKIDSWLLMGAVPDQKAIQGSQTDMGGLLRGTREKNILQLKGNRFALQATQWFLAKSKLKIEIVATPDSSLC